MNQFRLIFTLLIIFSFTAAVAQPRHDMVKLYGEDAFDYFYDVFPTSDGGYAMCGRDRSERITVPWILLTDSQGEQTYSSEFTTVGQLFTIIEVDDGGFLAGGFLGNPRKFWVVRIDRDGNTVFSRNYSGASVGQCQTVIEMKGGNFMIAGRNRDQGYLASINDEGDVNWEEYYRTVGTEDLGVYTFYSMRETGNGLLIAGGGTDNQIAILMNVEADGEEIWASAYHPQDGGASQANFRSIISYRDGFAMVGENVREVPDGYFSWYWFVRVNADGGEIWNRSIEIGDLLGRQKKILYSLTESADGALIGVGNGHPEADDGVVLKINKLGELQWFKSYPFVPGDDDGFYAKKLYSTVVQSDGSIIAVGQGKGRVQGRMGAPGGLLLQLVPERSAPKIIDFEPEKDEFNVLVGDSVVFAIEAIDQQFDDIFFNWDVNGNEVDSDSSLVVHFDELGTFVINCDITDGDRTNSIDWVVHVENWYLDSYSPDNLFQTVRRPHEMSFNIEVRAIEGLEPEYRWRLTDRQGRTNYMGFAPEMSYDFDLKGNYRVEGRVSHEDVDHTVEWQITVNSVLYWWQPRSRSFEVPINQEIEFILIPFNPDSDSLRFRWLVDGRNEGNYEKDLVFSFDTDGVHIVRAIVRDGAEMDDVIWTVTVVDPNVVSSGTDALLPTEVTLYPAAPNPFNSTTSIRYFLPWSADVRVKVYDSGGRLMQTLSDELKVAGEHHLTLIGAELPAGVYLLRLETGSVARIMKVVLLN